LSRSPAAVIFVRVPVRVHDVPENSCTCTGTRTARRPVPPAGSWSRTRER
jgi:hypothetical protein